MPTSSQSKILSVVDYQLVQQQGTGVDELTKPTVHAPSSKTSGTESKRRHQDDRRRSIENKSGDDNHSPPPSHLSTRRLSSSKNNDSKIYCFK